MPTLLQILGKCPTSNSKLPPHNTFFGWSIEISISRVLYKWSSYKHQDQGLSKPCRIPNGSLARYLAWKYTSLHLEVLYIHLEFWMAFTHMKGTHDTPCPMNPFCPSSHLPFVWLGIWPWRHQTCRVWRRNGIPVVRLGNTWGSKGPFSHLP